MTSREPFKIIKKAAENAIKAGFDGVELHAANGYLLQQFFSKYANHRTDAYGGSIENRARVLFEILDKLKGVIDYSRVGVRLNPALKNALGMMLDEESIKTHEYIVKRLKDYGVAYVHLIEPMTKVDDIPYAVTEIAKHFRPMFKGILIANRRFTRESGNQIIEEKNADLVSFGVPFIANPDLVKRFTDDLPLAEPDASTFYTPGAHGYTDYPFYIK
jgi:N-ethylmaleimide reductase